MESYSQTKKYTFLGPLFFSSAGVIYRCPINKILAFHLKTCYIGFPVFFKSVYFYFTGIEKSKVMKNFLEKNKTVNVMVNVFFFLLVVCVRAPVWHKLLQKRVRIYEALL